MGKVRIFSLAKQLGLRSEALVAALAELGVEGATPASAIDEETARAVAQLLAEQARQAVATVPEAEAPLAAAAPEAQAVEAPAPVAEEEEAEEEPDLRRVPSYFQATDSLAELEKHLQAIGAETPEPERFVVTPLPALVARQTGAIPPGAVVAPPVVTVLGHVDHGKTTLLDSLRKTNVVESEHGGITQHIGASEVERNGKTVVFIDTPGHEAFTAMRARGARVTDIAILIVAADDGLMPQTVEAIGHAKAANVPIIVAINKVDLPGADPERVKQQLLEHELVPEEWGGDVVVVEISALTGQGLDELLEMVLLVADVQQFWAEPDADFAGIVIEATLDPSQGALTTVLVRRGTLAVGDTIIAGTSYGRVRRLRDWKGQSVKSMPCGHPVAVVGLNDVPEAGDTITTVENAKVARQIAQDRAEQQRAEELAGVSGVRLRALYEELHGEEQAQLNIVLKGDVWGSVQAMVSSLEGLGNELKEINLTVVHRGVGEISESDITLAVASKAIVLGFNVGASEAARRVAEDERVEIRTYNVIYEALQDIRDAMYGMLQPVYEERPIGQAQVLQIFRMGRTVAAGCRILDGRLQRGAKMRVVRNGQKIHEGAIDALRHFDREVNSLDAPNECGVSTSDFRTWQEGDRIEAFVVVEVERRATAGVGA